MRVEPSMVDSVLPAIEPILKTAIPHTSDFETISEMVETMRQAARPWQLWVMLEGDNPVGGFISTMERIGSELLFQFEILAGVDAQAWILPLIHNFEQYLVKMYGVTQVRIVGRQGWARFLKESGYAPEFFVTSKKLVKGLALPPDNP